MKYLILILLFFAGCGDNVNNPQSDSAPQTTININYNNDGRVENLNIGFDSVTHDNSELLIFSSRVYSINKDSIINYIIK